MIKKYSKSKPKRAHTWAPESRETDRYGTRWHDGEEYTRVGDEYRPKHIETDDAKCWEDEGNTRRTSRSSVYSKSDGAYSSANSEKRHPYRTDAEQENVTSGMATNALVHRGRRVSKASEAFR